MIGSVIFQFALGAFNSYIALAYDSLFSAAAAGLCFGFGISMLIMN